MNDEIYQEIQNQYREEELQEASQVYNRAPDKEVKHPNDVSRIIYEEIGPKAPGLFFAHCNTFVSDMLQDGWNWFSIEIKLRSALSWVRAKKANHAGLRTLLSKIRNKKYERANT